MRRRKLRGQWRVGRRESDLSASDWKNDGPDEQGAPLVKMRPVSDLPGSVTQLMTYLRSEDPGLSDEAARRIWSAS
jgi:hypothetical protein